MNDISIYEKNFEYKGKIKFNSIDNIELSTTSKNNKNDIKKISNIIETNYSTNKKDSNLLINGMFQRRFKNIQFKSK